MRKDIPGYEGLYQADSEGFIVKISRPQKDKRYGEYTKEVILKPYLIKDKKKNPSYYVVSLSKNNVKKKLLVHRIIYQTFNGEIPEGLVIDHLNGIKTDNRIDNLEACSHQENTRRAFCNGLMAKEFDRSFCKTNKEKFELLLKCLSRGVSYALSEHIAEIPRKTVTSILSGQEYKSYRNKVIQAIEQGKKVNTEVNWEIKEFQSP